ncbi:MAG: glycosyltransferase [Pseudomonadota bacterium]
MSDQPLVTVVIPTYNALGHLPDCLASISEALGEELGSRVVAHIQDGASDDGSAAYLEKLTLQGVSHSIQADSGIYDAMNSALAQANSPFVYFLGADDRLLPGFANALDNLQDPKAVYYGNVLFAHDMKPYDGPFNKVKLVYRNICHQAIIYPRQLLLAHPFDARYAVYADWAANIALMARHPFVYLALELAVYDNTGGASFDGADAEFGADKHRLLGESFGPGFALLSRTAPLAVAALRLFQAPRRPGRG